MKKKFNRLLPKKHFMKEFEELQVVNYYVYNFFVYFYIFIYLTRCFNLCYALNYVIIKEFSI